MSKPRTTLDGSKTENRREQLGTNRTLALDPSLLLVSQKLGSPHELLILFCLDHGVRLQIDVMRTAPGIKLGPRPSSRGLGSM